MPKLSTLTLPIQNSISVWEYVAEGQLEQMIFNVRHKRLTSAVIEEVNNIQNIIFQENNEIAEANAKTLAKAKDKKIKAESSLDELSAPLAKVKNALAAQLAYLVEYTDIVDEDGNVLPPTLETFSQLPINTLRELLNGIMKTTVPEKKPSISSTDGMQPEE